MLSGFDLTQSQRTQFKVDIGDVRRIPTKLEI